LGNLLFQYSDKIETRRDAVDIHEQLIGLKRVLVPVEKAPGMTRIIATAIIDENFTPHGPPPCAIDTLELIAALSVLSRNVGNSTLNTTPVTRSEAFSPGARN
jgi:hypothetical protein